MADEVREEDEWLYGDGDSKVDETQGQSVIGGSSKEGLKERLVSEGDSSLNDNEDNEKDPDETPLDSSVVQDEDTQGANNNINQNDGDSDDDEEEDSDDDDDGVQVVIGDIKSSAAQNPFGGTSSLKRPAPPPDKKGKFSVEDFETPGTINGVSALEFNIDGLEDKPWRKPGADITDYFNYGFTEETWKAYSDRQKRMRFESGGPQIINPTGGKQDNRGVISVAFGQMQGQQRMEMINRGRTREEPKENTIQVMTADRREYSRKNFEMGMGPGIPPPFDMSVPPPNFPPPGHGNPDFLPNPEYFNHPPPPYYPDDNQGYDDNEQWMDHHSESWDMGMSGPPPTGPSAIVSLTKASNVPPPPGDEETSVKNERKD